MADFDWLSAGATVLGGLLGGSQDAPQTTSTSKLDPRIEPYIYGGSGYTGVLPAAQNWFNQNSTGLNPQMVAGLNRQYNVYSDPQTAQGYTNQQNLGQALLGAPIAGNPFTSGQMSLGSNQVRAPTNPVQQPNLQQTNFQNPATQQQSNPYVYTAPTPVAPKPATVYAPAPGTSLGSIGMNQGDGQGNNSSAGGGYGGTNSGTGLGGSLSGLSGLGGWASANAADIAGVVGGLLGGPMAGIAAKTIAAQVKASLAQNDLPTAQALMSQAFGPAAQGITGTSPTAAQAMGWGMGDMMGSWGGGTSDGFGRGGGFGRGNSAGGNDGMGSGSNAGSNGNGGNANA